MRNHVRNPSNRNRERCKAAVQNDPRRSFCTAAFLHTKERVRERWRRHCDFTSAGSVLFAWTRMRNRMFWFRTAVSRDTGGFVNSAVSSFIIYNTVIGWNLKFGIGWGVKNGKKGTKNGWHRHFCCFLPRHSFTLATKKSSASQLVKPVFPSHFFS